MAYTKTNWTDSTPINTTNLNKIESGIEQNSNDIETLNTNVGDLTNLTTTEKGSLVGAINEVAGNSGGADAGTILWTNSSPTSEFVAQNLTVNMADYDLIEMIFKNATNEEYCLSTKFPKGKGTRLIDVWVTSASKIGARVRNVTYVDDNTLAFDSGHIYTIGGNSYSANTSACVPIYIIGYKTGLFS